MADKLKPKQEESRIQQNCITWFKASTYKNLWLTSIKNSSKMGGKTIKGRNGKEIPLEAIRAKKEGLKAGTSDLFLYVANHTYHGLAIETKTTTGRQSKEQKEFQAYCIAHQYKYVIIRSLEQFIKEFQKVCFSFVCYWVFVFLF